ncbi:hypothetical protein I3760_04G130800, partial [Carya illinoinensis]
QTRRVLGSYYEGTVVAEYRINNTYAICYKDLLTEDESHALIEVVGEEELRLVPPKVNMAKDDQFVPFEEVDAFDNDGWWVGKISGRKGASKYNVFFDGYGVEILYPSNSQLRPHLEWIGGQWVSASPSRKRMF